MARQAHAERAWAAIERFYKNCPAKVPGKKGYPNFKKYQVRASVEYKTSGWKLSEDRRYLKLTDKFESGTFKRWGSRDLHYYQIGQIKRVRIINILQSALKQLSTTLGRGGSHISGETGRCLDGETQTGKPTRALEKTGLTHSLYIW